MFRHKFTVGTMLCVLAKCEEPRFFLETKVKLLEKKQQIITYLHYFTFKLSRYLNQKTLDISFEATVNKFKSKYIYLT